MKVLLTGAGGSIGVHFIAHIMNNTPWDIVALDSFRHKGDFDRITEVCKEHPEWRKHIEVMTHDLTAPFTKRQVEHLRNVDIIINLASLSDVQASIDDPVPFVTNNTSLMLNVLELARDLHQYQNLWAFLHFSTDEVYGPAEIDQGHPEWSTILPSNPYAASKAMQEALAISYWRSYNVPLVITNTMNNFGEMQQSSKYPVKVQKAVENDEAVYVHIAPDGTDGTRYYLHSRNAADAALFILHKTVPTLHKPGHVDRPDRYNIVGDIQLTNTQMAQGIGRLMGKKVTTLPVAFHDNNPGHDLHYGLDGEKLANLGWKQPVSFPVSMAKTIKWQQEHPLWLQ